MKLTVTTPDGETIEVDHDSVQLPEGAQFVGPDEDPEGYVTVDELKKREQKAKEGLVKPSKILGDDDLFVRAANRRGLEIERDESGNLKIPQDGPDREKIVSSIEEEKVKPLKKELEERDKRLDRLQQMGKRDAIIAAAKRAGVRDTFLNEAEDGHAPPVVNQFGPMFDFAPDAEQFAVRDGEDGFKYGPNPSGSNPYLGPYDFFKRLRQKEGYDYLFDDKRPDSTGLGGGEGSGSQNGRTFTRSEIESMSDEEYENQREEIMKAHKEGRIVEG